MASGERTLVIRLGGKCLYPLSHLVNLGFSPTEAARHTLQGHVLLGVCASLHLSVMPGEVEGGWNCDTAPPVPSPVSAWTPPQVPSGWSEMRLKSSKEARIPTATSPLIELKLGRLFCQASVRMGRIMSLGAPSSYLSQAEPVHWEGGDSGVYCITSVSLSSQEDGRCPSHGFLLSLNICRGNLSFMSFDPGTRREHFMQARWLKVLRTAVLFLETLHVRYSAFLSAGLSGDAAQG